MIQKGIASTRARKAPRPPRLLSEDVWGVGGGLPIGASPVKAVAEATSPRRTQVRILVVSVGDF